MKPHKLIEGIKEIAVHMVHNSDFLIYRVIPLQQNFYHIFVRSISHKLLK